MSDKVMLAVNATAASSVAGDWVVERARHIPCEVEVTSVLEEVPLAKGFPDVERDRRQARLDDIAAGIRHEHPGVDVTTVLRSGRPERVLVVASASADLLVVGMGRVDVIDEVAHLPLGLRLAGRTRCVLVVVPKSWAPGGTGVVVGWDDDPTTEAAVAFALREARRTGQPLTIVHADASERVPSEVDALMRRTRAQELVADIRYLPVSGPVPDAVLDAARGASLLVLGSHGRNAIEDLLLGSVSESVLAHSALPVAITPAQLEPIVVSPEILDEDLF